MKSLPGVFIRPPSSDFMTEILGCINEIECKDVKIDTSSHFNYHTFFSEMECAMSTSKDIIINYSFRPNRHVYKKLYEPNTFSKKCDIAEKVDDYGIFQNSFITGVEKLESIADALDSISDSGIYEKNCILLYFWSCYPVYVYNQECKRYIYE